MSVAAGDGGKYVAAVNTLRIPGHRSLKICPLRIHISCSVLAVTYWRCSITGGMLPMNNNFKNMLNPEKFGYIQCPHCNGYGSSLEDPEGVNICTRCGGSGLIEKKNE